jgi:hypothetical protein
MTDYTKTKPPSRPILFADVCRIFRRRILDGDDWVAVFDCDSRLALEHIRILYYRGVDFDEVLLEFHGEQFTIVALPKSKMRRWQYEEVLKGYGAKLPGPGRIERDGLLCVTDARIETAYALASAFGVRGEGLGMEA